VSVKKSIINLDENSFSDEIFPIESKVSNFEKLIPSVSVVSPAAKSTLTFLNKKRVLKDMTKPKAKLWERRIRSF